MYQGCGHKSVMVVRLCQRQGETNQACMNFDRHAEAVVDEYQSCCNEECCDKDLERIGENSKMRLDTLREEQRGLWLDIHKLSQQIARTGSSEGNRDIEQCIQQISIEADKIKKKEKAAGAKHSLCQELRLSPYDESPLTDRWSNDVPVPETQLWADFYPMITQDGLRPCWDINGHRIAIDGA